MWPYQLRLKDADRLAAENRGDRPYVRRSKSSFCELRKRIRIGAMIGFPDHYISDTTVSNVLKRSGLPPAGDRKKETTWAEFVNSHMDVLVATDFFTAEVWSRVGFITYYVLFFIHLGTRKVNIAGITLNPHQQWMAQIIRNITDVSSQQFCEIPFHLPRMKQRPDNVGRTSRRGARMSILTPREVATLEYRLNTRPRKRFDYLTPIEFVADVA